MRWWIPLSRICKFVGLYRLIYDRENSEPYLHRYYLLSTRWLAPIFPKLSYRIVLHNCVQSDADGLHDHPWNWWSKILSGGYWEHVPGGGSIWRAPDGGWRKRTGEDFHRLVLDSDHHLGDEETWSLFVMGPRYKDWGFQDKNGDWVQWEEYINNRHLYV